MHLIGVDISEHNHNIDFNELKKSNIDFVMIRMGYGSNNPTQDDKKFHHNVSECERVGLPWGAYLYSYALNMQDVLSEYAHAKRLMLHKNPQFPVAFDMEDADHYKKDHGMPNSKELIDICYYWLSHMEEDGFYVSLYANRSWLNGRLKSPKLNSFDKWVADWNDSCGYNGRHEMWQYTNKGQVQGIDGYVDMNVSYTDFQFDNKKEDANLTKYKVKQGDTLIGIANQFHTSVLNLLKLNPIIKNPNVILEGWHLTVPKVVEKNRLELKNHKVKSGQTLSTIAKIYGTTVDKLMKLNPEIKDRDLIFTGQSIRVPKD